MSTWTDRYSVIDLTPRGVAHPRANWKASPALWASALASRLGGLLLLLTLAGRARSRLARISSRVKVWALGA